MSLILVTIVSCAVVILIVKTVSLRNITVNEYPETKEEWDQRYSEAQTRAYAIARMRRDLEGALKELDRQTSGEASWRLARQGILLNTVEQATHFKRSEILFRL